MWLVGVAISIIIWVVLSTRIRSMGEELKEMREQLAEEIKGRTEQTLQGSLNMFPQWQFSDTSKGDATIVAAPSAVRLYGERFQSVVKGQPRISIFAHEDEAGIIIRDEAGRERLTLGFSGDSFVQLLNEEGELEWGFPMELDEGQLVARSLGDFP